MKFLTNSLVTKFSDGIREGFHVSLTKYPSLIFVFLVVNFSRLTRNLGFESSIGCVRLFHFYH